MSNLFVTFSKLLVAEEGKETYLNLLTLMDDTLPSNITFCWE